MAYDEASLSSRQRDMLEREENILQAAQGILLSEGFYDMSMARVAEKSECPRGTIYRHFASREDIVVALACRAWTECLRMLRRGAEYPGPSRARMAGAAEGFALFYRLYPDQFAMLDKANHTVREKASLHRIESLRHAEAASADIVRSLLADAVRAGELRTTEFDIEEVVFAISALATGGFGLHQSGFVGEAVVVGDVIEKTWWAFNMLADAYGWRPLTHERDWDEALSDVRRAVFPEESMRAYGEGAWYGTYNNAPPALRRHGIAAVLTRDDLPESSPTQ
ncbi:MAG: TetR/AcrR family transcriptional regulator [Candidatus Hydrogenedentes bacterium]|nr:TetR/AcrR family transcriptional regulator [Candidatus Hydrogenedentota bacterium]